MRGIGLKGLETLFHASGQNWGLQDPILCLPRVPMLILEYPWQRKKTGQSDMTCYKCARAAQQWALSPLGTQHPAPTDTGYAFLAADKGLKNWPSLRFWKYEWHLPVSSLAAPTRLAWFLKDQRIVVGQSLLQIFLNTLARHLSGSWGEEQIKSLSVWFSGLFLLFWMSCVPTNICSNL